MPARLGVGASDVEPFDGVDIATGFAVAIVADAGSTKVASLAIDSDVSKASAGVCVAVGGLGRIEGSTGCLRAPMFCALSGDSFSALLARITGVVGAANAEVTGGASTVIA